MSRDCKFLARVLCHEPELIDLRVSAVVLAIRYPGEAALAPQGEDMIAPALPRIELANLLRVLVSKKTVSAEAALDRVIPPPVTTGLRRSVAPARKPG